MKPFFRKLLPGLGNSRPMAGWILAVLLSASDVLHAQPIPTPKPSLPESSPTPSPVASPSVKTAETRPERFTRTRRDAQGNGLAVETSIAKYTNAAGREVSLISAIHVGDIQYYQNLNDEFKKYDAVLFELIAPEKFKFEDRKKEKHSENPVTFIQHSIQSALDLQFQLDRINYSAPNMVHADVSPDQFMKQLSKSAHGNVWQSIALAFASGAEAQKKKDPIEELKIMMVIAQGKSEERTYILRRYLADQFEDVDDLVMQIDGIIGEAVVQQRNAKAIEVLEKHVKKGEKRIAIFYGAAHMADMEKRMNEKFHTTLSSLNWLTAWCLVPDSQCRSTTDAAPDALPTTLAEGQGN